jgi:arylsulfatase A-like enzyme
LLAVPCACRQPKIPTRIAEVLRVTTTQHPRAQRRKRSIPLAVGALTGLLLGASLPVVASHDTARAARRGRRPNVLIFVTDDQRSGDTMEVMPATRRLFKKQGTSFRHAFATTPLCCPSRASIMTGRYAHNHDVHNNSEATNLDHRSTLQRYLHAEGYFTGLVGKYLNKWDPQRPPPFFDRWALMSGLGYFDSTWNENGEVRTVSQYSTRHVEDKTIDMLRRFERSDDSRPWFMYVAPYAPHKPMTPQRAYESATVPRWKPNPAVLEEDRSDKPQYVQEQQVRPWVVRRQRRGQLRTLMSVDDVVAQIYKVLGRLDEDRRTLAFYLSDHGYLWGEHGLGGRSSITKRPPYTQSVKIPLFVRWPDHVAGGEVDKSLVATIDIAPTVLSATRTAPDPAYPLDGHSLLGGRERSELLLEYFVDIGPTPEWAAVRSRSFSYIEQYGNNDMSPTFREFYDLDDDRWENLNLFGDDRPDNDPDVAAISARLDAYRHCSGATCP